MSEIAFTQAIISSGESDTAGTINNVVGGTVSSDIVSPLFAQMPLYTATDDLIDNVTGANKPVGQSDIIIVKS